MTEEKNDNVQEQTNESSGEVELTGTVEYKTHKKLLDQRKADQAKLRDLEATLANFQAQQKKAEEDKLIANQQYKELAEQKERELNQLLQERDLERAAAIKHQKMLAFKEHVGDLADASYSKLVDWENINVSENGLVDIDSLKEYGNAFKAQHGSLFKNVNAPNPTSQAPQNYQPKTVKNAKSIEDLQALWSKAGQSLKK